MNWTDRVTFEVDENGSHDRFLVDEIFHRRRFRVVGERRKYLRQPTEFLYCVDVGINLKFRFKDGCN
jgi:hypothetical protein